jgi:hypothetical protein
MAPSIRQRVQSLLQEAAAAHATLIERMPEDLQASLPVDAQGLTRAIDLLADEAGLTPEERRALIRPHAVNPAVLHARVFGRAPLSRETVIGSFVEGARVRAKALAALADAVGGDLLVRRVREALVEHPLPAAAGNEAVAELRAAYRAQERAVVLIAGELDGAPPPH